MTTVTDRRKIDARVGSTPISGGRSPDRLDVKAIRRRLGLTQMEFARRYGLSLGSIRNWEQGCRQPDGPARILLRVIEREPEAVQRALAPSPPDSPSGGGAVTQEADHDLSL